MIREITAIEAVEAVKQALGNKDINVIGLDPDGRRVIIPLTECLPVMFNNLRFLVDMEVDAEPQEAAYVKQETITTAESMETAAKTQQTPTEPVKAEPVEVANTASMPFCEGNGADEQETKTPSCETTEEPKPVDKVDNVDSVDDSGDKVDNSVRDYMYSSPEAFTDALFGDNNSEDKYPAKKKKRSGVNEDYVVAQYKKGKNQYQLAKELGVSQSTISGILKRKGVTRK